MWDTQPTTQGQHHTTIILSVAARAVFPTFAGAACVDVCGLHFKVPHTAGAALYTTI